MDILKATAADLGRAIGAGTLDPRDVTEGYLSAIDAHPLRDRIYTVVTHDRARAEAAAAAARAQSGHRLSALDGVPLSWKDLYDSAGIVTEAGTALMKGRTPTADATVLQNATAMGTVCLGKTHMSEIAFSGLGYNPVMATPPCVNDPDAVPGGSSSGAAASVAFDLAPAAIGSDTGGSIRIPSAWNDLTGFKPTHGTHPLTGVVPLCATFDTVGPLCRSVEDAALVNAALGGTKPVDLSGTSLKGARLLILDTVVMEDIDAEPGAAFDSAVTRLAAAGAQITHASFPDLYRAFDLALPLYGADAYAFWRPYVEAAPHLMYDRILERVRGGGSVLAVDYIAGWEEMRAIRARYLAATAGYDAVICPSAACLPPKVQRIAEDADYYRVINLKTLRNTRMGNLMGLTSASLPTGTPSCGVMLNAPPGNDARLLRLAHAAQQALA
jgi:aspartyl-tRNA(Asn)/glutamyl-tRNA(Gln) amidotransferase subunit A